jgi:hypothetical protein
MPPGAPRLRGCSRGEAADGEDLAGELRDGAEADVLAGERGVQDAVFAGVDRNVVRCAGAGVGEEDQIPGAAVGRRDTGAVVICAPE